MSLSGSELTKLLEDIGIPHDKAFTYAESMKKADVDDPKLFGALSDESLIKHGFSEGHILRFRGKYPLHGILFAFYSTDDN